MDDLTSDPDQKGDILNNSDGAHYRQPPVGAPRWVKVFGTAMIALALVFVALHLAGHGFGSHTVLSSAAREP